MGIRRTCSPVPEAQGFRPTGPKNAEKGEERELRLAGELAAGESGGVGRVVEGVGAVATGTGKTRAGAAGVKVLARRRNRRHR